jgi:hypothetical protein
LLPNVGRGLVAGAQTYGKLAQEQRAKDIEEQRVQNEAIQRGLEVAKFYQGNFRRYQAANGQYIYRDLTSGKSYTEDQYGRMLRGVFQTSGLGKFGMGTEAAGAGRPSAITVPGAPGAAPSAAEPGATAAPTVGAPTAAAPTVEAPTAGAPVPATPLASSGLNLRENDNPDLLKQKAEYLRQRAERDIETGSIDSAAYTAQIEAANKYTDRADKIINGEVTPFDTSGKPVTKYYEDTQKRKRDTAYKENLNKNSQQVNNEAEAFFKNEYNNNKSLIDNLNNIYTKIHMNRGSEAIADMIGYMRSVPGLSGLADNYLSAYQTGSDAAKKAAIAQAFKAIADDGAQRAPSTALKQALQTVANSGMAAGAKYNVLVGAYATLEQERKKYGDFLKDTPENPASYFADWISKPENNPISFKKRAALMMPYFAGMTDDEKKALEVKREISEIPPIEQRPNGFQIKMDDGRVLRWKKAGNGWEDVS